MREFYNSGIIQNANYGGINVNGDNNRVRQVGNASEFGTTQAPQKLSLEEWAELEHFFVNRQLNYSSTDECFTACTGILQAIEKHDEINVKNVLKKIGTGMFNTLLGMGVAATTRAAVMPIIEKIIG